MRFITTAASALLAASQVVAAATVKTPEAPVAARDVKIAPKFFIISMVCFAQTTRFTPGSELT